MVTREIDLAGRTLGELPEFPGTRRVLFYGHVRPLRLPRALEARISELERQIEVKNQQHESEVGRRQREARILAPFTGKILRIDRAPADQSMRYLILYKQPEKIERR